MKKKLFFAALAVALDLTAQYAPPAGSVGSSAVHKDHSSFKAWATACVITRGPQSLDDPSLGLASAGDPLMATGKALENGIVSLGDGGSAVCTFAAPIINGTGADFAVFENSFSDTFLELAFVEVSSDGANFFRFPSHSLTDTVSQSQDIDARHIHNLAGKYRAGYGTPFDLDELPQNTSLDKNNVTHVRIIDVVGSLDPRYARRDNAARKINDPWPTPFPSSGFDLDAVGVFHQALVSGLENIPVVSSSLYPNPLNQGQVVRAGDNAKFTVKSVDGKIVLSEAEEIRASETGSGVFIVQTFIDGRCTGTTRLVVH